MKTFSPVIETILASGELSGFYLVKVELRNLTLMHTTLPYDVTIAGLGSFTANNTLVRVETPRFESTVTRSAYKLVYADPELEFKNYFEQGAVGSKVTVWLGFFNSLESVVGGVPPGSPILNPEDITLVYAGVLDSHGFVINSEEEILSTFECSSPMANLNAKKFFLTTDAELKKRNVNDTAFKYVHETSTKLSLAWGKI